MIRRLMLGLVLLPAAGVQAAPVASPAGLEARVARLERLLESQGLLQMYQQIEELQQRVRELQGMLEENGHALESIRRRQRDLYLDIDRRLRPLETAAPAGTRPAGDAASAVAPSPSSAVPVRSAQAEDAAYRKAFELLKEGSYARAAQAFRTLLKTYPDGAYADNAQYWLGEVYYVTRDFDTAREAFRKVLERYPTSGKVADARLKLGYIHYEKKQWREARAMLEGVIARHPGTRAARLARERLDRMKAEGH